MPTWQGEEIPEQLSTYLLCLEVTLKETGKRLVAAHDRIKCADIEMQEQLSKMLQMQEVLEEQDRVLRQIRKESGRE